MFLFEDSMIAHSQTIRGVRYITTSYYGGSRDVFQKMGDLITASLTSSIPPKVTKDSLVGSGIALGKD
ncbi:hypothetical protein [Vermiculatibacterium agrestimuris]|uniref:hypothetical protein n=1 Tax=Vermiculatibacterium agrestimuris TaxID=2941519 RepID=UPI00203F0DEB|nr:hypothetical protein [Vermiculatibacterium agrestimuris]